MKDPYGRYNVGKLRSLGLVSEIDERFALAAARLSGASDPLAILGAAAASRFALEGHVCADLSAIGGTPICPERSAADGGEIAWPEAAEWVRALRGSAPLVGGPSSVSPLVLDGAGRLYLRRYFDYESSIAARISAMVDGGDTGADRAVLSDGLNRLFGPGGEPDCQKIAAMTAVLRRFCVISGGPGTGKTSTVVRVIVLLAEQARAAGKKMPRVLLVAPTGKAKARLEESIRKSKAAAGAGAIDCPPEILAAVPPEALTVHKAIGARPGRPGSFRFNAANLLPVDVLVCDEASMVDVALMARLLDALPGNARVILLGDRDQLASVEAGAVLADICEAGARRGKSDWFAEAAASVAGVAVGASGGGGGIGDCVALLSRSFRFDQGRGIGRLAAAINSGDGDAALEALAAGGEVELVEAKDAASYSRRLASLAADRYGESAAKRGMAERLTLFNRFRVLCAHREGPRGAAEANSIAQAALESSAGLDASREWYDGRPVIITANDYQVGLFNGDVGMIGESAAQPGALRAFFTYPDGTQREVAPTRLPAHETVFAMTVHKSQGSEFDEVAVVLPEKPSPVVTRELLYTAVTRARSKVWLFASRDEVKRACSARLRRFSGLLDALS